MKKFLLFVPVLFFCSFASAQTPPVASPAKPAVVALSQAEQLTIENLSLKQQIAQRNTADAQAAFQKGINSITAAHPGYTLAQNPQTGLIELHLIPAPPPSASTK